jgi:5-methylcytosine-specific restriction endonuclease McrA
MDKQLSIETYDQLLKKEQWLKLREKILARDQHKCRNCDSDSSLQIHHRQYHINVTTREFVQPWEYNDKYLITLCNDCHQKGHNIYKIPNFTINKKKAYEMDF